MVKGYTRFNAMKEQNPKLKTLLAVGGWNHPMERFTNSVATPESRAKLNKSIINWLRRWGFDGFDLDWEYPGNRGSPAGDKQKFTAWCKELREAFEEEARTTGNERLLLSAAVGAGKSTIDKAYEIGKIAKSLDFINLMTYDLHGSWEKTVNNIAPFKARSTETGANAFLNVEWASRYWLKQIAAGGEPSTKLILGLPTYGRSFTLASAKNNAVGAPAKGPGSAGRATKQTGFLAYYEICQQLKKGGTRVWDDDQQFPYAYWGNQWVGYDDMESLKIKIDFIKKEGLGGGMFWALDLDDFKGQYCGQGKYPLINFVKKSLAGQSPEVVVPTGGPAIPDPEPEIGNGNSGNDNDNEGSDGNEGGSDGNTVGGGDDNGIIGDIEGSDGNTVVGGDDDGPFRCPELPGLYMNRDDCTTFYSCDHGIAHLMHCPDGLLFNSASSVCDWPQNSDCPQDN